MKSNNDRSKTIIRKTTKTYHPRADNPLLLTGSPSSKYEHRRTSALLRNIRNTRICMGKKPIVSATYENEKISIKKTAYLT